MPSLMNGPIARETAELSRISLRIAATTER